MNNKNNAPAPLAPVGAVVPAAQTAASDLPEITPMFLLNAAMCIESPHEVATSRKREVLASLHRVADALQVKRMADRALAGSVSALPDAPARDPDAFMTTDRKGLFFPSFFVEGVSKAGLVPLFTAPELTAWFWRDGAPDHPWDKEWFLAKTIHGDRVVLRALDKDYNSYDYTTADHTYMKRAIIKQWAQFPDSAYVAAPPAAGVDAPTLTDDQRDKLRDALSIALGEAMDCTRVWSAWGVGTMSEDDFQLVADNDERLEELVEAVAQVFAPPAATKTNAPTQTGDAE